MKIKFKTIYKCLGCEKSFDKLEQWEEHYYKKKCKAIGYEVFKTRIEKIVSKKNVRNDNANEPTLKQSDLTKNDKEKVNKLLNKEEKKTKKETKKDKK